MSEIELAPLSQAEIDLVAALMNKEEQAWLRELDWDYAPIRRILFGFLEQRLLPGFVAISGTELLAYTYFLISRSKGMIGTVFVASPHAQHTADLVLSRAIESLKETRNLRRIEAQIIPLNGLDLTTIFSRHGFQCFLRHYLELDLAACAWPDPKYRGTIVPWHPRHLLSAAEAAYRSYRNGIDAVICEDYGSEANCEAYLRSLVENPGCGIFQPDSSFVGLDSRGTPCGFILTSRLSAASAMIPQISIHPAHQGRNLGSALIHQAVNQLKSAGYRTVRLTVTRQNRRAYEWYLRLGFKNRRDFGAYLWQRDKT
ncbi:MAG: GNAT family N-acetyltransferase [Acidobacteriia bacterium]|nr:GNAT family N-acetyltransferase [Terriglobia bacterium]